MNESSPIVTSTTRSETSEMNRILSRCRLSIVLLHDSANIKVVQALQKGPAPERTEEGVLSLPAYRRAPRPPGRRRARRPLRRFGPQRMLREAARTHSIAGSVPSWRDAPRETAIIRRVLAVSARFRRAWHRCAGYSSVVVGKNCAMPNSGTFLRVCSRRPCGS